MECTAPSCRKDFDPLTLYDGKRRVRGQHRRYCSVECRRSHKATGSYQRPHHLKRLYGMTLDEYQSRLTKQNFQCAICGNGEGQRSFNVDHNHVTGQVRGLLCTGCNRGIGFFCEDLDRLRAAICYLEKS